MSENNMNENRMNESNDFFQYDTNDTVNVANDGNPGIGNDTAENSSKEPEMSGVYSNASFREVPPRKEMTDTEVVHKKKKKSGGFFKKALVSISLGILFGLFAGAGFYAVQRVGDMLMPGEAVEENSEVEDALSDNSHFCKYQQYYFN